MKTTYLDHASTTQIAPSVLAAMVAFETAGRANVHRGLYPWAAAATEAYEAARSEVAGFIGADSDSLVFTKSTTEGLNLVARGIAERLGPGDEVIVTIADHHANVLPWMALGAERGFTVRTVGLNANFALDVDELRRAVSPRTRVIALPLVSNVLGTIFPVAEVVALAQSIDALVVVDGAQAVGHIPVDVAKLGIDAFAFSAHKMYGPMGIGALYLGERLRSLPPLLFGGGMVDDPATLAWKSGVERFEGGTPNVTGAIGFAEGARFVRSKQPAAMKRELELTSVLIEGLAAMPGVTIIGAAGLVGRIGIVSFTVDRMHSHDIAQLLGDQNVCVRAGHHCAAPLAKRYCEQGSVRVSVGLDTTQADVEAFFAALEVAMAKLAYV